jgi:hypothetical protein
MATRNKRKSGDARDDAEGWAKGLFKFGFTTRREGISKTN